MVAPLLGRRRLAVHENSAARMRRERSQGQLFKFGEDIFVLDILYSKNSSKCILKHKARFRKAVHERSKPTQGSVEKVFM